MAHRTGAANAFLRFASMRQLVREVFLVGLMMRTATTGTASEAGKFIAPRNSAGNIPGERPWTQMSIKASAEESQV